MATVLDPDGDPILDPDGFTIDEPTGSAAPTLSPGHLRAHGGMLGAPISADGLYDPFDRADVNPPPFGGTYTETGEWEIVAGRLRSVGTGVNTLVYDTGHRDQDLAVSLAAVPFGYPNGAGIIFRWETGARHAWIRVWEDENEDDEPVYQVQVHYRDDTNPTTGYSNAGAWPIESPVGRLRAVITGPAGAFSGGPTVTVYWNGIELGSVPTTIDTGHGWYDGLAGKVGLYADGAGSIFDDLVIADPNPTVVEAGHITVHGGTLDAAPSTPSAPSVHAGHATVHGGTVTTTAPASGPVVDTGQLVVHGGTITTTAITVPSRTFALAGAVRGPVAYGPRITTSDVPPPLVVRLYHATDLTAEVAVLDQSYGRRWQDQLNEAGSASVIVQNDDPALALIDDGDVLRFELEGWAAFACLIRERDQVTVAGGEEAAQATTLAGPGTLALLDTAVVYPARGVDTLPAEEDRLFSWVSVDYDDTNWPGVSLLVQQGFTDGTYWAGLPADWPDPSAWWVWADVPNALEWAPGGNCYYRTRFTVPDGATRFAYYVTFDWRGEVYLDGQLIASGEYGIEPDVNMYSDQIEITPGEHTLAIRCENDQDPEADEIHNPGGILFSGYAVDQAGNWLNYSLPIVHTDDSWRIVAYPPNPPGMTPGEVIRHVVQEAQGRGALLDLTFNFTDEVDAEGAPWPEVTDIATKVGTDILTFLREMSGTYIDFWIEPAGWRLWAWVRDGRGTDQNITLAPADPDDPRTGNLRALGHKKA